MKEILAKGIDISEAQTNIDWDKLDVDFVIIRAGYGRYTKQKDKMFETHYGLSKEYEVSCEELDFLNDIAKENGVTGSRIMGGGFGGCTINLVKDDIYDTFIADAKKRFNEKYGHEPAVIDVIISEGSHKVC